MEILDIDVGELERMIQDEIIFESRELGYRTKGRLNTIRMHEVHQLLHDASPY